MSSITLLPLMQSCDICTAVFVSEDALMSSVVRKQSLVKHDSRFLPRFCQLSAVSGVILLIVHLKVTDYYRHASRVSSEKHRQRKSNVTMLYNYGVALLMSPRNDTDSVDDRIISQINFINFYAKQKRNRTQKIVLNVGNKIFFDWLNGENISSTDKCPIVDCWMTTNHSYSRVADALLISRFDKKIRHRYLPKPRRQVWIAHALEPPFHNAIRIDPYTVRGLINWTGSYRHDSTIPFRYYKMAPGPKINTTAATTSSERHVNYAAGKTKLVAWLVSRCVVANYRKQYVQELSQFIQVWHKYVINTVVNKKRNNNVVR